MYNCAYNLPTATGLGDLFQTGAGEPTDVPPTDWPAPPLYEEFRISIVFFRKTVLALVAAIGLCTVASAQVQNRVSPYKVGIGGWVLNPIIQTSSGNGCVVHSFVALSKAGSTYGQNIVAVWYIRGDAGKWETKSWHTVDQAEAIKYVKAELAIPDSDDALWDEGITTAVLAQKATSMPEDYLKGLLSSDPYAQVVNDPLQREFVVEVLADAGYAAAKVPLDKSSATDCSDTLLTKLASEVETAACSTGGVNATEVFKANAQGTSAINPFSPFFSALCCLAGQTFEFIGPEGEYSPVPDYSVTPPATGWVYKNYLPIPDGACVYERFECNEQVKTVIYIASAVPSV